MGVGSAGILSKLFPTVILGNLLAIISAGLISRIFKDSKGMVTVKFYVVNAKKPLLLRRLSLITCN
ncbi:hypothetical protein [Weissella confusa]|uniref:hypothetical protein n=1 Tax=Weissella confusa TaxID=1583 RepID=UPI00241384FF|nr:hypothetical protein [Weissella confusa]